MSTPKPKRPRKAYRPKGVNMDPMRAAKAMASLMTQADRDHIVKPLEASRDALGKDFTVNDWRNLADGVSVARELKAMGIVAGPQADAVFDTFHSALVSLDARHRERGTWTPWATEIEAIRDGVWLHEVQLQHCSMLQFQRSWNAVVRKGRDAVLKGYAAEVQQERRRQGVAA